MGQELNGLLGSWVTLSDPFPALPQTASRPGPLPELRLWTPLGDFRPLTPWVIALLNENSWHRAIVSTVMPARAGLVGSAACHAHCRDCQTQ